jgi:hypothetical protein
LFQRKLYDAAMRTLTEYRRHLDGRSSDTTDGNRHWPAWFSLRIADLVAKKARPSRYIPFQTLVAVDARGIFAHSSTCDVETGEMDMRFGLVKFSRRAFCLSATAVTVGPSFEVRPSPVELSSPRFVAAKYADPSGTFQAMSQARFC